MYQALHIWGKTLMGAVVMSITMRCLALGLILTGWTATVAEERKLPAKEAGDAVTEAYLTTVRAAAAQLANEIESLQQTIIAETADKKDRSLYQKADVVLDEIGGFQRIVKAKVTRDDLYKRFDQLDESLHGLIKAGREQEKGQRALMRALNFVQAADDHLHYVLSEGDVSEKRAQVILARQARALTAAVAELESTANFALGAAPGAGVLLSDLRKFHQAAEVFSKNLVAKADRADLQKRFAPLQDAWNKVIRGMKLLPERENVFLLHSAARVDQLYDRVARLLGIDEKRPQLIVNT
jgi:hypothetical protein